MKPGDRVGTATVTTVSGPKHKPRPNHPTLPTWGVSSSGWWSIAFRVGCVVVSEANRRGHWAKEHKRKVDQQVAIAAAWLSLPWHWGKTGLPFRVTLIHHGSTMDGDNLQRAFKAVRDYIAGLLGVDDGDERVTWQYQQTTEGEPGVVVRIEGGGKP